MWIWQQNNTETLKQTKSTSQHWRARPKTKRQSPANLIKSLKLDPSLSLKPEQPASNQKGQHNSDQAIHQQDSLLHKTSYIRSIHNKWITSRNDQTNNFP